MAEGLVATGAQYVDARVIDGIEAKLSDVRSRMAEHLSPEQSRILSGVLREVFHGGAEDCHSNERRLEAFLAAKSVEGCTERTIAYYQSQIMDADRCIAKPWSAVSATDIRTYLGHKKASGCNDVTINNVRRVLSSFFQWLEDEDVIRKSPVKKVKAIRCAKREKAPFSGEEIELIRRAARSAYASAEANQRNVAMVELLLSSGMRAGELVGIRKPDMDVERRETLVFGKGRKERMCYFSAAAAIEIQTYLDMRRDGETHVFVASHDVKGRREPLRVSGVEAIIRHIGMTAGVEKCHPHRFRRTMATRNLGKGMRLEELKKLLGHESLDTTMIYARVDEDNVRNSARRLI